MSLVRARDVQAFEALYRIYQPRLVRFLTSFVHRPPMVEEVVNDTMMVVWNRPDSFNGASKLSTWIFGIAYRKGLKALRRRDDPVEDAPRDRQVARGRMSTATAVSTISGNRTYAGRMSSSGSRSGRWCACATSTVSTASATPMSAANLKLTLSTSRDPSRRPPRDGGPEPPP